MQAQSAILASAGNNCLNRIGQNVADDLSDPAIDSGLGKGGQLLTPDRFGCGRGKLTQDAGPIGLAGKARLLGDQRQQRVYRAEPVLDIMQTADGVLVLAEDERLAF